MSELVYTQTSVLDHIFSTEAGPVPAVYNLMPKTDERGYFSELWRINDVEGFSPNQLSISYSQPKVLRGLHWQLPPQDMSKFITCLTGFIYDIIVDIRKDSSTFKKLLCVPLQLVGKTTFPYNSIFVPAGFAHGFYVPGDEPACVHYIYDKCYDPSLERNCSPLCFLDLLPVLELKTKDPEIILSEKDKNAPKLDDMDPKDLF